MWVPSRATSDRTRFTERAPAGRPEGWTNYRRSSGSLKDSRSVRDETFQGRQTNYICSPLDTEKSSASGSKSGRKEQWNDVQRAVAYT